MFVTPDKESSMNTLWREEEFEQICRRKSLTEKVVEIENPISVKEQRYNSNPTIFYKNRFWNRRLDGIVINKNHRRLYILEFKWSSDTNEDFLGVKEDEATEQHKSVIEALKAAAPDCTFEQINFVAGKRGAVVENDFYNKLESLSLQAGKKDKILTAHVQRICEGHDTVIRSYFQQIHGVVWC